jgi:hypothetical protein
MSLSLVHVVCRQVEVSATGRLLIQRSAAECGAPELIEEPGRGGLDTLGLSSYERKLENHII